MCQFMSGTVQERLSFCASMQAHVPVLAFMASSGFVIMFAFQGASLSFSAAALCHRPIWSRVLRLSVILDAAKAPGSC